MVPKSGESTQAASNNEWLEFFNSDSGEVDLSGWKLVAEDGSPDIDLFGIIVAHGYFLLERSSDEVLPTITADIVYPYKNALSNSGEKLFLKNSSGAIVDEINALAGWQAGDNNTKDTMQKSGGSWITASATPKTINFGSNESNVSTQPPETTNSSAVISYAPPPSIKAFAGEDRTIMAGSEIYFLASALGADGENLEENTRFWWNFGDGESKEGRAVFHVFQIPGTYTVGLHVSTGIYAASDYAIAKVELNKLEIKNVILGEDGFVSIANLAKFGVDIGGWILDDGTAKFIIPAFTKIGPESQVALPNNITKLLLGNLASVTLRYANGREALVGDTNKISVTI